MDPDLSLCLGLLFAALSIPAMVSAYSDRTTPRLAALVLLGAAGLIVFAVMTKPGGYTLEGLPEVIYGVIGRVI